MGKIQELTEQLANQIAAGEVVERPASVVKELVENAIDAGSTQIDIMVEESGLKKIQVIDNGEGIAPEDVENAFKRHATSKIHTREDLFRIRSLGFRGEALPSIASVSEITMTTSTGAQTGTMITLKGGKVTEIKPHSLRQGTNLTVANLFFNTPARLKYVKSLQAELAQIGDIVNRLALSHPHIAFRVTNDGNSLLKTAGNGELKQTIAGIYGLETARKMVAVTAENLDFQVSGYISLPELTRARKNYLSLIINGRYIKNFLLNKAIVEGYGSKLMVGRFPIAVLEITMDPLLVDVNVHPTKQEVRLSKEKELMTLITTAIDQALRQQSLIPNGAENVGFKRKPAEAETPAQQLQFDFTTKDTAAGEGAAVPKKSNATGHRAPATLHNQGLAYDAATGKFYVPETAVIKEGVTPIPDPTPATQPAVDAEVIGNSAAARIPEKTAENPADRWGDAAIESEDPAVEDFSARQIPPAGVPAADLNTAAEQVKMSTELAPDLAAVDFEVEITSDVAEAADQKEKYFPDLEYFGQMHGTYLFAQSQAGLYIVDQHAAQERIKYEYYRVKIGEVGDAQQELLVPLVLEYPNSDALKLKASGELLAEVGIFLEEFGQNTFLVRSHPAWYPTGEEEATIQAMIEQVLLEGKVSVAKFREDTAIMMSCKKSIKANHYLEPKQARQLLKDLAQCENPYNCPHGRPVLVHFTNKDMEKMFKRIQDPH